MVKPIENWKSVGLNSLQKFIWTLIIAMLLTILQTHPVIAGCGGPPQDPDDYFRYADAVFIGKVTSDIRLWKLPNYTRLFSSNEIAINKPQTWHKATRINKVRYTIFEVRESYKGVATTQVIVETRCIGRGTLFFQVGDEYLVYANEQDGHYVIMPGSGTSATRNSVQDLIYLSDFSKLALTPATLSPKSICIVITIVLIFGAITGTIYVYKKSKTTSLFNLSSHD